MPFYDRYYWGYKSYKPDKNTTARALDKLKKKGREASPVIIDGRDISKSWWGIKWCRNLESYSDYYNRLERGRSYVKNGAVIDLKILPGRIEALVQGSDIDPYEVEISIKPLKNEIWKAMAAECAGKIHSLGELFEGRFPMELSTLFTAREKGIFPSPSEIDFECSCPDYAFMCKHVAAVLYGVGARLDKDPALFFTLRNVNIGDIISGAVAKKSEDMLKNAGARSGRVLVDDGLAETFGIDIAGFDSAPAAAAALPPKAELTPEKNVEKEDKIIFEELPELVKPSKLSELPKLPEVSKPSKTLELSELPATPLKNAAKSTMKLPERTAAAESAGKTHEKSGAQKSRLSGGIKALPDRIKALVADIENISSANELDALAGDLAKLSKITVKKIELLKALDELRAV
jgi:uncharacterized Zn finger protein